MSSKTFYGHSEDPYGWHWGWGRGEGGSWKSEKNPKTEIRGWSSLRQIWGVG